MREGGPGRGKRPEEELEGKEKMEGGCHPSTNNPNRGNSEKGTEQKGKSHTQVHTSKHPVPARHDHEHARIRRINVIVNTLRALDLLLIDITPYLTLYLLINPQIHPPPSPRAIGTPSLPPPSLHPSFLHDPLVPSLSFPSRLLLLHHLLLLVLLPWCVRGFAIPKHQSGRWLPPLLAAP